MANSALKAQGCLPWKTLSLINSTLQIIKATSGLLYGLYLTNRSTSPIYVKLYDAASGTIGTGTPVLTFEVPANSSDHVAVCFGVGGKGVYFDTGICIGASTSFADNDTGAPAANALIANAFYL